MLSYLGRQRSQIRSWIVHDWHALAEQNGKHTQASAKTCTLMSNQQTLKAPCGIYLSLMLLWLATCMEIKRRSQEPRCLFLAFCA